MNRKFEHLEFGIVDIGLTQEHIHPKLNKMAKSTIQIVHIVEFLHVLQYFWHEIQLLFWR